MIQSFREYLEQRQLVESSLSRIYAQYKEHESGTISAFRGNYSKSENLARSKKLKTILENKGYSVTKIDGVYIENYGTKSAREVREESYIVIDIKDDGKLEKTLRELGEQFEQDSITFSQKDGTYFLIGTSPWKDVYPGNGKRERLGKPMFSESGEFHSKINNRPFVFK